MLSQRDSRAPAASAAGRVGLEKALMATGTLQPTVVPPPPAAAAAPEPIIHKQLRRTSLHVRLVDLAASLAVWGVGILAFLLVAAVVDHWLGGLGFAGRAIAFLALAAGSAWF